MAAFTGQLGTADSQFGNIQLGTTSTEIAEHWIALSGSSTTTGAIVLQRLRFFTAVGASTSQGTVFFTRVSDAYAAAGASSSAGTLTFTLVPPPLFIASGASVSAGTVFLARIHKLSALASSSSTGSVVFRLFVAPYVPGVLGLTHVFTSGDGLTTRTLPDPSATFPRQVVGGFQALGQAPGGFISATGEISQAEFDANPLIYTWGTTWRILNADDSNRVVWAGRLTDPQVSGGKAVLHAEGWGAQADKEFDHLLWQTRDLDKWTVADSDPFNYDTDRKIQAEVVGRGIRFKVRRKEVFKRNNAGSPTSWSTGVVFWAPQVDLNRIKFTIDKERDADAYDIQLLRATGPSGALTLVATYSLGSGGPTTVSETITGNPDLLMLRMRRQSEDGKTRAFRCVIKDVKVNGLAGTSDTYTVDQVVSDIAARIGGNTDGIEPVTQNALPLDVEDSSAGAILDELGLLVNRNWGIEDNGTTKAWMFKRWDAQTWVLATPQSPVEVLPVERFNQVRVPYRYPGGVKAYLKRTASPNPFAAGFNVKQIDLDDPLPPEDIAAAFAQNLADDLGQERYAGTATFVSVEDDAAPGVLTSGWRVKAGDRLKLPNNNDLILRIEEVTYSDEVVTVRFSESNPLLERVLRRRNLILARGRGNAWATLGGFDLERPSVPTGVTLAFKEAERRGGRRKFHAVLDWNAVTEDIEGNGTAIQRYVAHFQPVDASGVPIPELDGGGITKKVIDRNNDNDPDTEDIATKAILRNLEHPHSWRWRARVKAVDVLGEKSYLSAWTPYAKPATFGPPDPTNLTVKLQPARDRIVGEWDALDPTELDTDGSPVLDRRIAYFEVRLRRRLKANPGDPFVTYRGPRKVGKRTEFAFKDIAQMGRYRWRYQVRSGDAYGNTTSWT